MTFHAEKAPDEIKEDGLIPERLDYGCFLDEFELTEEDIQAATHSMPVTLLSDSNVYVGSSNIDGMGLFAKDVSGGDVVAPMMLDGEKTEAGRYTNHSHDPNAIMIVVDHKNIDLVATRDINNEEVTIDYRKSKGAKDVTESRAKQAKIEGSGSGVY